MLSKIWNTKVKYTCLSLRIFCRKRIKTEHVKLYYMLQEEKKNTGYLSPNVINSLLRAVLSSLKDEPQMKSSRYSMTSRCWISMYLTLELASETEVSFMDCHHNAGQYRQSHLSNRISLPTQTHCLARKRCLCMVGPLSLSGFQGLPRFSLTHLPFPTLLISTLFSLSLLPVQDRQNNSYKQLC